MRAAFPAHCDVAGVPEADPVQVDFTLEKGTVRGIPVEALASGPVGTSPDVAEVEDVFVEGAPVVLAFGQAVPEPEAERHLSGGSEPEVEVTETGAVTLRPRVSDVTW